MAVGETAKAVERAEAAPVSPVAKRLPPGIISLVILALAVTVFFIVFSNWNRWQSDRQVQTTDDAYVRADMVSLGTKAAGVISKMAVAEFQTVKAGQLIATIEDRDYLAQVSASQAALDATLAGLEELRQQQHIADEKIAQAQAGIAASESQVAAAEAGIQAARAGLMAVKAGISAAEAQSENALQERKRQEGLYSSKATTLRALQAQVAQSASADAMLEGRKSELNSAQAQIALRQADRQKAQAGLASSKQDLAQAISSRKLLDAKEQALQSEIIGKRAALDAAKIASGYTQVVAPTDGIIASRDVLPGQMVGAGTPLVTLVEGPPWVQANYEEVQLGRIAVNDQAEIRVDTFPSKKWKGHVLVVAPTSGAQTALIPPDNATGNFTKITQRIPVKISFDSGQDLQLLRPGMSATVSIKTGTAQ
jgi:membrane fusion protein (multidrug efflux system)